MTDYTAAILFCSLCTYAMYQLTKQLELKIQIEEIKKANIEDYTETLRIQENIYKFVRTLQQPKGINIREITQDEFKTLLCLDNPIDLLFNVLEFSHIKMDKEMFKRIEDWQNVCQRIIDAQKKS